jgi:hypothetical protein
MMAMPCKTDGLQGVLHVRKFRHTGATKEVRA